MDDASQFEPEFDPETSLEEDVPSHEGYVPVAPLTGAI
jgi:hypothetical protein